MTNVRRPIHLQLRLPPSSAGLISSQQQQQQQQLDTTTSTCSAKSAPSATFSTTTGADLLPSQIMPNLFVGNLEQTNRETVNRLNISYILSLGLLPLISSSNCSPTSPTKTNNLTSTNSTASTITVAMTLPAPPPTPPSVLPNAATTANIQLNDNNNINSSHHILLPTQNSSKDFKIRIKSSNISHDSSSALPTSQATTQTPTRKLSSLSSSLGKRDENKGINNSHFRTINCKCINIADNNEQLLAKFFDEAHQFIDEARKRKRNVLVHCLAGISRSPTIAIAYLMRCNSLRLEDAYNFVKRCRPQIDPNLSFMGQLMIYEKNLDDNTLNNGNNCISRLNKTNGSINSNSLLHHQQQHAYHHRNQAGKLSMPS